MSYTKIWIHCVWSTARRDPLLTSTIRVKVFDHISAYSKSKGIYVDVINGYVDHVHCLISMNREQNIANCMRLIKGESSFWINKNKLTATKFSWQDDYFAVSIGESQLTHVRKYIRRQEEHHSSISFIEEHDEFIKRYDFRK